MAQISRTLLGLDQGPLNIVLTTIPCRLYQDSFMRNCPPHFPLSNSSRFIVSSALPESPHQSFADSASLDQPDQPTSFARFQPQKRPPNQHSGSRFGAGSALHRWLSRSTSTLNTTTTGSSSSSTNRGIVVVCPGRLSNQPSSTNRLHRTTSLDLTSSQFSSSTLNNDLDLLNQLRLIASFKPLLPLASTSSAAGRRDETVDLPSNLPRLDCTKLLDFGDTYQKYLKQIVDRLGDRQSELSTLQNRIDHDLTRLVDSLRSRQQGRAIQPTTLACPPSATAANANEDATVGNGCNDDPHNEYLFGQSQVDSVIRQTSQISSLIGQCQTLAANLDAQLGELAGEL